VSFSTRGSLGGKNVRDQERRHEKELTKRGGEGLTSVDGERFTKSGVKEEPWAAQANKEAI